MPSSANNKFWILCGLCSIAASTMMVEIILTKFIGYKVFYHFINLIITTVILSFGAAGTFLYLKQAKTAPDASSEPSLSADGENSRDDSMQWHSAAREAALYSVLLTASILLFCWMPLDPYNPELH